MRHDKRGAIVIFECINQALDAFHVQVVRRFVKQKHVAFVRQNLAQKHTAAFTTRKHLDLLHGGVAAEHHHASKATRTALLRHIRNRRCNFFFDRIFKIQAVDIRLTKVIYLEVRVVIDCTLGRFKFFRNQVQERRFTTTVWADNRNAVTLEHFHLEVRNQLRTVAVFVLVRKREPMNLEHALAREFCILEIEIQVAFVREALTRCKLCRSLNL